MSMTSASERASDPSRFGRAIIGRVSRTFALGIRALSGDLGRSVLVGYLLCRIADTIEDDGSTPAAVRADLLRRFLACFRDPSEQLEFVGASSAIGGSREHRDLLASSERVFALFASLRPGSQVIVERWTRELVGGMIEFVERYPDGIRIQTMTEYRRYCYFVAGTIGHLLTELWRAHLPYLPEPVYRRLLERCEAFGEGLQTINILKDIAWDIEHENAAFVPEELLRTNGVSHQSLLVGGKLPQKREAIVDLIALAKHDLSSSLEYIRDLPKFAPRVRFFCLLPVLLAAATLREIERSSAMFERGGVVKITRREVRSLVIAAGIASLSNRLGRWFVTRAGRARFEF